MYSDLFCKVYNEFGWNYYPQIFGEQLLQWLQQTDRHPETAMDLACGTGILCGILQENGIQASGMDFSAGMIEIAQKSNPGIDFQVADMVTFRSQQQFDLVTCTGDALNHIGSLSDLGKIFENVYAYTKTGGCFIFDLLNEQEAPAGEPFEMDFTDTVRVWFQMTRPEAAQVNLKIRVYENGVLNLEEDIRETIHDPAAVCALLRKSGFSDVRCTDRLLETGNRATTWFVIARKEEEDD